MGDISTMMVLLLQIYCSSALRAKQTHDSFLHFVMSSVVLVSISLASLITLSNHLPREDQFLPLPHFFCLVGLQVNQTHDSILHFNLFSVFILLLPISLMSLITFSNHLARDDRLLLTVMPIPEFTSSIFSPAPLLWSLLNSCLELISSLTCLSIA